MKELQYTIDLRSCIFILAVGFLFFCYPSHCHAEDRSFQEKRELLFRASIQSMHNQDYEKALQMSTLMLNLDPRDPEAYKLMALALWHQKAFMGVIKAVVRAEQHGVRALQLYQLQAEAFFMLEAYEPALQALAKMEDLISYE